MRQVANTVIVVLAVAALAAPLQARMGTPPLSMTEKTLDVGVVEILELAAVDPTALLLEDQMKAAEPGPLRFALPADVRVTPAEHGTWKRLADGRLWQLRVVAPGATDLNFGFGRFRLPKGATLHVLSLEEEYYQGPYTGADHHDHGQLWTPVVPGAEAMIELYVPANAEYEPELELVRVGRGYRDLFGQEPGYFFPYKQGSCNIDVICPLGDDWRDQIRAVAVYGTGGSTFCTGTLINNLREDLRPFFLTANHCGITSSNAASVVAYWNYESPTCGALSGGSLSDNTSGATFRASNYGNDMTLIEFNSAPDAAYDVYYSGFDARTTTAPQSSIGIHHPSTDEKAISYNDDPLTTVNSCIGTGGVNTHWEVNNWEQGTTEPGSSGSGLWDPATHLLVGYLSGGQAACGNSLYDCYGKISVGWGLGLSGWLDPDSTGTRYVAGRNPGSSSGPTVLQNGVPVTGVSSSQGQWKHYKIAVPSGASNLVMQISGSSGDADLYTKFGSQPTSSSYDCRPYASGSNESCSVASPSVGDYYVSVYAYSAYSNLTVQASYATGGGPTVLQNGVPVTGVSSSQGQWKHYKIAVPSGASNLVMQISGSSGDADLYTKFGSQPTSSSYDCRPYLSGSNESCTVASPSAGDYYLSVYAYSAYSNLTVQASYSTATDLLQNGVPVTGLSASTGNWKRYRVIIPSGASNLVISISGGTGDADLYTRFGAEPTTTSYNCRPYLSGNNETCSFASPSVGTYYVGVRAYSTFSGVSLVATWNP